MAELQQLQNALTTPERNNLVAIVSLTEMVVLKPALNSFGRWDAEDHRKRVEQLITRMKEYGQLRFRVSLDNYFTGHGSIARSIVRRKRRWWWVNSGCQKVAAIFIRI